MLANNAAQCWEGRKGKVLYCMWCSGSNLTKVNIKITVLTLTLRLACVWQYNAAWRNISPHPYLLRKCSWNVSGKKLKKSDLEFWDVCPIGVSFCSVTFVLIDIIIMNCSFWRFLADSEIFFNQKKNLNTSSPLCTFPWDNSTGTCAANNGKGLLLAGVLRKSHGFRLPPPNPFFVWLNTD